MPSPALPLSWSLVSIVSSVSLRLRGSNCPAIPSLVSMLLTGRPAFKYSFFNWRCSRAGHCGSDCVDSSSSSSLPFACCTCVCVATLYDLPSVFSSLLVVALASPLASFVLFTSPSLRQRCVPLSFCVLFARRPRFLFASTPFFFHLFPSSSPPLPPLPSSSPHPPLSSLLSPRSAPLLSFFLYSSPPPFLHGISACSWLFLSAHSGDDYRLDSIKMGCNDCICKPIDWIQLADLIRRFIPGCNAPGPILIPDNPESPC